MAKVQLRKNDRILHDMFGEGTVVGFRDSGKKVTCDLDSPPDDGVGERRVFPKNAVTRIEKPESSDDRLVLKTLTMERTGDGGLDVDLGKGKNVKLSTADTKKLRAWLNGADVKEKAAPFEEEIESLAGLGRDVRNLFKTAMGEVMNPSWGDDQKGGTPKKK